MFDDALSQLEALVLNSAILKEQSWGDALSKSFVTKLRIVSESKWLMTS